MKGTNSIDILPKEFNAHCKIHEYGGGAMTVGGDGNIIFTDGNTDGVFKMNPASREVTEIVKGDSKVRFADFNVNPSDHHAILSVQEDHRGAGEVVNNIALLNTQTNEAHVVVQGADFYTHPKFSPNGKKVSWVQWNHPDMPWTGSELYIADWKNGSIENATKIAGQARVESIVQPKWLFDGSLMFASDKTGFWQVYVCNPGDLTLRRFNISGFEDVDLGAREIQMGLYVESNSHIRTC